MMPVRANTMIHGRLLLAGVTMLVLAGAASAQMLGPGMPMAPQQQQVPPCMKDFAPLKDEAEKRGVVLKAAISRKVKPPPEELCGMFKRFAESEAKLVKFLEANQSWCGIPPQSVQQSKANHAKTLQIRDRVCSGGPTAGGPPKPTGPGLSEALGTIRLPTNDVPPTSRSGTLDTLNGNVLTR